MADIFTCWKHEVTDIFICRKHETADIFIRGRRDTLKETQYTRVL